MPKISVIIPCYNSAKFLAATLESVYAQSFTDYEIIVVDDGSTDLTREVLEPYRNRLRYHYQENQGAAVARNVAMRLADGEYISCLDSDDIWEPDNLKVKYEVLERFPNIAGVFGDFSIFDESGERWRRGTKLQFPLFDKAGLDYKDIFQESHRVPYRGADLNVYVGNMFGSLFLGNFVLPTSMVFSRAFAKEVGEMRPDMRTNQDYEYWLRFAYRYRFAFIDHPFVRYRRHAAQLTDPRHIERILKAVSEIIDGYETEFMNKGQADVFGRRKAELLCTLAKVRHRQERGAEARELVGQSIRWDRGYWLAYGLYGLSFVPFKVLSRLRSWLSGRS